MRTPGVHREMVNAGRLPCASVAVTGAAERGLTDVSGPPGFVQGNRPDLPVPKSPAALGRPARRRVASSPSGRGVHDVGTAAGTGSPRPAGPQATVRSARAL